MIAPMPDFAAAAPVEPAKRDAVHERDARPSAPADRHGVMRLLLLVAVGAVLGAALLALAFQSRASWTEARDWVVPVTVPLYALGGVALASLALRRAWMAASGGLVFLGLAVALTGFNLWRAALTSGPDGLRDGLSIGAAVCLALAIAAFLAAAAWVETRRPAPPPDA